MKNIKYNIEMINNLNADIKAHFSFIKPIEKSYKRSYASISRMVMLDRYAQKDKGLITLRNNDLVIVVLKEDPVFPSRGIGFVERKINNNEYAIRIDEEYVGAINPEILVDPRVKNVVRINKRNIDKPLEIFYEQIAKRVSEKLGESESAAFRKEFFDELKDLNIVPAGRILYGAGSNNTVTFFNCFVMPMIKDSREGISDHRKEVMEIMSRGGGVGTNGSTLRPHGEIAKGVGGRSSGSVSWLNDLASLTNLVEQGGSRRGAQMIMLSDWHPDVIEFIISKMQNPKILQWLIKNGKNDLIKQAARNKLVLNPMSPSEGELYKFLKANNFNNHEVMDKLKNKYDNNGTWEVQDKKFLTGANISINISDKFMEAVDQDANWSLRFPDLNSYSKEEKLDYDLNWNKCGNVDEWAAMGHKIKTYATFKARDLWELIVFCATYSAEPGIFFIDRANKLTNASAYGMKVVATNPCGEQPLAPYSVCNLAALNLANFVDKEKGTILWDKLAKTINVSIRMMDNVIDKTYYSLPANEKQAKGERRIGLGVMGLHDLLIWNNTRYGSDKSIQVLDKLFEFIATTAYKQSINLAKEKGSFPFLTDNRKFIETGYVKKLPKEIKEDILKYGIRNSHLLTIAPTGSTGTMVGVSTGLEPYFAFEFFRSGRLGKNIKVKADIVTEWLSKHPNVKPEELPDIFISAMKLTPDEHVNVQCIIQKWVDSSISKTVNAPRGYSVKQVQKIYEKLYKNGAKGGTVYVDGSRDSQVLSLDSEETSNNEQISIAEFVPVKEEKTELSKEEKELAKFRGLKQDRSFGIKIGDICPLCKEGTMVDAGGCATCNNCNAQLKCGL